MSEALYHVPAGYLWLDLETTGLDPKKDHILEAAWAYLRPEEMWVLTPEGFEKRVSTQLFRPYDEMRLSPFVSHMHSKSGLLSDIYEAKDASLRDQRYVETLIYGLCSEYRWPSEKHSRVVLAGSSVRFDLDFLKERIGSLSQRLSYRVLDVSGLTLFCRSLGMQTEQRAKNTAHRAKDDIVASYQIGWDCLSWLSARKGGSDE